MGRRDGGRCTPGGLGGYAAKAGPKHHLTTAGSCFSARAIEMIIAQHLHTVEAGDLSTAPTRDEVRRTDEETRHTLRAPVNHRTGVDFTGRSRRYDLDKKRRVR